MTYEQRVQMACYRVLKACQMPRRYEKTLGGLLPHFQNKMRKVAKARRTRIEAAMPKRRLSQAQRDAPRRHERAAGAHDARGGSAARQRWVRVRWAAAAAGLAFERGQRHFPAM